MANNRLNLAVLALLVAGAALLYAPRMGLLNQDRPGVEAADGFTYIADLDFWQRTNREISVTANARLDLDAQLDAVPLTLGRWQGEERPDDNQEVEILLEPEQYVRRLYQRDDGHYMWLSLIGGRSSQPFHPPDICYDVDGWLFDIQSKPVALAEGGEVYGYWMEAEKQFEDKDNLTRHAVFYFYLFPDGQRSLSDGIVLFKLTSHLLDSTEETLALHEDFVRNLFLAAQ